MSAPSTSSPAHVHATVDHRSNEGGAGARLVVEVDVTLMRALGVVPNDTVRIATGRGRHMVVRLGEPNESDTDSGRIRLDRFIRQALKAHLNENLEIEAIKLLPAPLVELTPAVDVSMAHDLIAHLKRVLVESTTPVSKNAVLYIPFPGSPAGTTYQVHSVEGGNGIVTDATEIVLHYHDAHLPDGAFDITFEDIGGLGSQIQLLRELVQLPLKFPHVYRQLGISAPRGLILYGPPGSGKTHIARAVANELDARIYYISGPDIIGTFAGETEGNLRRMFSEASHHAPSIIFIDELDAIAPKRGQTGAHSDTRIVTQLLALMDGLTRVDSVVIIATTNRVEAVDPAFRRPGRFDREIFVGPPEKLGRREILEIHSREMPLAESAVDFLDEVARRTHGFVGADLMELCRDAGLSSLRRSTSHLKDHRAAFQISSDTLQVTQEDFEMALSEVRPSALRETIISRSNVTWGDIGGLEDVRAELRELVELPMQNAQLLAQMHLAQHAGILLYGPSGTGKTLLAKAIANECGVNFIAVEGPELFTKWLGESEESVRHIFRIARQVAPTVIFFDQLDSIAPIRGDHAGSMTTERVVNQLLSELDGVGGLSRVIVIGATNRIDLVDPSILRPGRFGTHLLVPLPDLASRAAILRVHLRDLPYARSADLDAIVEHMAMQTAEVSGAQLALLCERAKRGALRATGYTRPVAPTLADMVAANFPIHLESRS